MLYVHARPRRLDPVGEGHTRDVRDASRLVCTKDLKMMLIPLQCNHSRTGVTAPPSTFDSALNQYSNSKRYANFFDRTHDLRVAPRAAGPPWAASYVGAPWWRRRLPNAGKEGIPSLAGGRVRLYVVRRIAHTQKGEGMM